MQRVEDLNAVVPAGHPQLATPQHDARVRQMRLNDVSEAGQWDVACGLMSMLLLLLLLVGLA